MELKKDTEYLIEVKDLKRYFPVRQKFFKRQTSYNKAVDNISFGISRGETLGLLENQAAEKQPAGEQYLNCMNQLVEK